MDTMGLVYKFISGIIAITFLGAYAISVVGIKFGEPTYLTLPLIANAIFKDFILAFEVLSILLLASLIGAIYLARKNGDSE
ncbi:MAG: hypothetical protein EF812_00975 [Methanosarcinales archaeon]|nr:MAG: hypothetical protein EF812_00975 [Methanosarcinales archaeon]